MKTRTTRILATTLATTMALTAAASAPARAEQRVRTKPQRPIVVEYPVQAKKYKRVRHQPVRKSRHVHDPRQERYGQVRYRIERAPRRVIVRPVYSGAFVINRPRFVVVRPVPVWVHRPGRSGIIGRVSLRFGNVVLAAATTERAPRFGCNFCDAYFAGYGAWERHVMSCAHWRSPVRVIALPWEDGDIEYFRQLALDAHWESGRTCVTYRDG